MENNVTHLGLDVHKDSIAVAVLRPGEVEPDQRVIANTPDALRKLINRVSDRSSLVACYEAAIATAQATIAAGSRDLRRGSARPIVKTEKSKTTAVRSR